jgi:hypothetical protein
MPRRWRAVPAISRTAVSFSADLFASGRGAHGARRPSGDLIKTGGKQAYFATARIADIVPDPSKPDHFYALIRTSCTQSCRPEEADHYYESGLCKEDGSTNKGAKPITSVT